MKEIIKDPLKDLDFLKQLKLEIDPIESEIASELKSKIFSVYSAVKYHGLYISNLMLSFKDNNHPVEVVHFPSALMSAFLLNRSSTMVGGGSGAGKTATIRFINRFMTGSSIESMDDIVHCHKEIHREDWIGSLDLKKVIKGEGDDIIWGDWTKGYTFTVDEVTRGNTNFQNSILLQMSDGRIQYNTRFKKSIPEMRYFMTENPRDEALGNIHVTPLSHAFLDRVTQYLLVGSPSEWAMIKHDERRPNNRSIGYSDDKIIQPILTLNELRSATILAEKMPIDIEARNYAISLAKNADLCIRAPLYSKGNLQTIKPNEGLCEECHFEKTNSYCKNLFCSSMRMYTDLLSLGKCYAFWLNLQSVTKYLLNAIAPDVISHRVIVPDRVLREDKKNTFGDKRRYLKQNFIDFEFGQINKFKEVKESFNALIYGRGTKEDLDRIKNVSNSNLSTRIELLPMVTLGIDITKNIQENTNKEIYSCAEQDYKEFMKKIHIAYKKNQIDVLTDLMNESGSFPMRNLIQDVIHEFIQKIEMKTNDSE